MICTTAIGMLVRKARLSRKRRLMMFFSFFENVLIPIFRLLPIFGRCAFLQWKQGCLGTWVCSVIWKLLSWVVVFVFLLRLWRVVPYVPREKRVWRGVPNDLSHLFPSELGKLFWKVGKLFWQGRWENYFGRWEITLAGGKIILKSGKIILAGQLWKLFFRWKNYFGRWYNYFGRWENYFDKWWQVGKLFLTSGDIILAGGEIQKNYNLIIILFTDSQIQSLDMDWSSPGLIISRRSS